MTSDPIHVLVVASWYPAVDDTAKGRFVADQVAALVATGRVAAHVVSFEAVPLSGSAQHRTEQLDAFERVAGDAAHDHPALFSSPAWGSDVAPVARLPVAIGAPPGRTRSFDGIRAAALRRIAERPELRSVRLVHAHRGFPDGAAAAALADVLGCPLVITEHATYVARLLEDAEQRQAYATAARRADRFVCVSRALASEIEAAIPEVTSKLVVIPNAVATDDFRAVAAAERDPYELLYVGYRTESKGIDVLLRAFAGARAERPQLRLRLVGRSTRDEDEQRWRTLAASLGVRDAVDFGEPLGRAAVAEAMQRAALLVHASRRETFGVAIVEALSTGLPVVAAATEPLQEIFASGGALGALVPVDDAAAMTRAILETLDRRLTFDAEAMRSAMEARYSGRVVAEQLVALYDELRRPGAASPWAGSVGAPENAALGDARPARLVIGLRRAAAATRLRPLPSSFVGRLALLTEPGDPDEQLDRVGTLVQFEPRRRLREELERAGGLGAQGPLRMRVWRLIRHPRAAYRRRTLRRHRTALEQAALAALAERFLAGERDRAGRDGTLDLVALEGDDYLAAAGAADGVTVRVAPGALRWLADRECAEGGG